MIHKATNSFARRVLSPRKAWQFSILAGLLMLGLAQAAGNVTAQYMNGKLIGPQVFAGEGYQPVSLVNSSDEAVTFTVAHLNNGIALGEFETANAAVAKAMAAGGDETAALKQFTAAAEGLGGTVVKAHSQVDIYVDLEQGNYVVSATPMMLSTDARAAAAAPSYTSFMVTESGEAAKAPKEDNSLSLTSMSFPTDLKTGSHLWKVTNTGDLPYVATFYKLEHGKTQADLEAYLSNPSATATAPYDASASLNIGLVTPGETVYIPLDFAAGDWVAVSSMHAAGTTAAQHEGTMKAFTVGVGG